MLALQDSARSDVASYHHMDPDRNQTTDSAVAVGSMLTSVGSGSNMEKLKRTNQGQVFYMNLLTFSEFLMGEVAEVPFHTSSRWPSDRLILAEVQPEAWTFRA